jgi:hypothetical protein
MRHGQERKSLTPVIPGRATREPRILEIPGLVGSQSSGARSRDPLAPSRNDKTTYPSSCSLDTISMPNPDSPL